MIVGEAGLRQPKPAPDTPSNVLQQFSLKGKVVVVNGAADGIGYAVVEAMAEAGADVCLWYNSNDAAISKAENLAKQHNIKAKAYQVQVTDPKKVEATIDEVVTDFGKLDVFVPNAGAAIPKPVLEMSLEEYQQLTSVNCELSKSISISLISGLTGHQLMESSIVQNTRGAVFKEQGFGNLIITSSISAHIVNVPSDQPVRTCRIRPERKAQ